ncbi:Putative sugar transporter [Basidiobolus ranarum]|uniref:Sugar transporter n=1 Tax=Basidiobolus ranarum TaxID=34480 RepID=A0ABR2W7H1_9FUNG
MFLSSLSIGWRFVKERKTGSVSIYPFLATFTSSLLWLQYGIFKEDAVLIIVSAVGISTSSLCILAYYHYTKNKSQVKRRVFLLAIFFCSFLVLVRHLTPEIASSILGVTSSFASVCMYAAPLVTVFEVIRTKSTISLSLPLSATSFVNCILWLTYGYVFEDLFIIIPNSLGSLLTGFQLILFMIYGRNVEHEIALIDV